MFIRAQVAATQVVLADFQGTVGQGETTAAGQFTMPQESGDLQTILTWPGSKLDLRLTDPDGTKVGPGYPGYKIAGTARPRLAIITNAKPGAWTASVYGRQVSQSQEPFYAIASFQKSTVATVTVSGGGGGGSGIGAGGFVLVLLLGGVGLVAWLVVSSRKGEGAPMGASAASQATLALVDAHSRRYPLRVGVNAVGRDFGNEVMLDASSVSRRHATLSVGSEGLEVRDLGSTFGTRVNGTRVGATRVLVGDEIAFGDERLRVRDLGGELLR